MGTICCLIFFNAICTLAFSADDSTPQIELTELSSAENVTINALITDQGGDLITATMYVADEKTHNVLWTERKIINGSESKLTFVWPRQMWRVTNGTNFVEPVLAVNTIDMPSNEASYLFRSAPCLLRLAPDAQEVTTLAYFGQDGELQSLEDLSGISYYKSRELLKAVSPETPYGRYVMRNITLIVGMTSLRFFRMNLDEGLAAYPPMVLSRSPIQHYTIRLEKISAEPDRKIIEIDAEDSAGNRIKKFSNDSALSSNFVHEATI